MKEAPITIVYGHRNGNCCPSGGVVMYKGNCKACVLWPFQCPVRCPLDLSEAVCMRICIAMTVPPNKVVREQHCETNSNTGWSTFASIGAEA